MTTTADPNRFSQKGSPAMATTTISADWNTQLHTDLARIRRLTGALAAAAADHDLGAAELHAGLDQIETIRAGWEHHRIIEARQTWARLEREGADR
ncbi:hypothetical protein [Nocardia sp. NPDC051832]|uniref:hypothetical protein n=1 Tax=Nocardia sp. NPDC051832 TaxID=3155673 RepID=UPI00343BCF99